MKMRDKILAVVEAAAWYGVVFSALYSIKHDVNLFVSALIILVLMYLAGTSCPIVRHTQAWKDAWKEQ